MELLPILVSLQTASVSIVITFFLGIIAAKVIMELKNEALKSVLDGILILPMVFPPTVAGFILLYLFGIKGPIGKFLLTFFGIKVPFSWGATVLAAVVISFPLMYRSARGAFEQVDQNLIYAARTLGLSEWKIFWRILMPMAMPGVVGGGILAFARGMGEFGATTMIAGNIAGKTRTLPLAVYSAVVAGDMKSAGYYALVILMLSLIVIVSMNYFTSGKHFIHKKVKTSVSENTFSVNSGRKSNGRDYE